jgi:RecA-family ATPase
MILEKLITAHELLGMKLPPPVWLVSDLIPQVGLTILGGPPKAGKSWFALQLASCVAAASEFLGRSANPANVAYYSIDDSCRQRFSDRLVQLDVKSQHNMHVSFSLPPIENGALDHIGSEIDRTGTRLVILDCLLAIRGVTRGRDIVQGDYDFVKKLKDFADEKGISLLLIHHTRKSKPNQRDGYPLDELLGTNGVSAAADAVLIMQPSIKSTTLSVTGRDLERCEMALEFDLESGGWVATDADVSASPKRKSQVRMTVLEYLKENGPARPSDIASGCHLNPATVRKECARMCIDEQLSSAGGYYQVPTSPELDGSWCSRS